MKAYLTRFNHLSDAVCNVDYLCHRGCSMSLTLHESCSITLALGPLGFPGRRGIRFLTCYFSSDVSLRASARSGPSRSPSRTEGMFFSLLGPTNVVATRSCRAADPQSARRLVKEKKKKRKEKEKAALWRLQWMSSLVTGSGGQLWHCCKFIFQWLK